MNGKYLENVQLKKSIHQLIQSTIQGILGNLSRFHNPLQSKEGTGDAGGTVVVHVSLTTVARV